jgi:hypothetical protein
MKRVIWQAVFALALLGTLWNGPAEGQSIGLPVFNDGHGREWRQLTDSVDLSWDDVAAICPTDGTGVCASSVQSVSLDGWVWAEVNQIGQLFTYFGDHPGAINVVFAPNATSHADEFLDTAFDSTYSDNVFRWAAGWTSTRTPGGAVWVAEVIDKYSGDPNADILTTADNFGPGTHPYVGLWLWRAELHQAPEPTTLALLGLGFAGLAASRRRRLR